jgi:hypothetical protein
MIKRKLVLVLGAGASMPYGFPSGVGLRDELVRELESGGTQMFARLVDSGCKQGQIKEFRLALKTSGKYSVDAFLEHRPEFLDVGKKAIAHALMNRERDERLAAPVNGHSWYQYLFNKLNARFDDFDKNSVSVITFNYDRSLERYLFTSLSASYGKKDGQCVEKLQSIPFVHVYGQLGQLPELASVGISYGAEVSNENLRACAAGIQIVHEDITDNPRFRRAHELLVEAERVCFLGFGYDFTNLERLMAYRPRSGQVLQGTAIGLTPAECGIVSRKLLALGFESSIDLMSGCSDSLDFLRARCSFDFE